MSDPTEEKLAEFARDQLDRAQDRLDHATRRRDESRAECVRLDDLVAQLEVEVAGWRQRVDG